MANRKIKISQLTELVSASLNTTIVGVDNGITYRMDLDTVADTLTSKVNISDRSRISALEAETGSYLTSLPNDVVSGSDQLTSSYDSRYILSGSITQTTWDNVDNKPIGLVSESTDLTQLNSFTESIEGRVFNLESATGSYLTSLDGTISSSQQITDFGFISESAEIPLGTISGSSQLTSSFDTRYTLSGSVQPLPNGLISGSSQLTSSFDERYTLSGSVQPLPSDLVSGSSQLTSSYDSRYSLSGSILTSFSSSVDNRLDTLEASIITGSVNFTQVLREPLREVTSVGVVIISGSITTSGNPVQIMVTGDANPVNATSWARLQIFRDGNGIGNIIQVENSSNLNIPYCLNVIDTPPAGTYTYSMRTVSGIAGLFDFGEHTGPLLTAVELNSQTSFEGKTLISGSSQLTSSFDERYTLSSSYSTDSASFDNRFNGLVTTGSNTFSGSQVFSGSMTVTSGQVIASTITNNSSSLFLQSGSNLYVQNDGLVEITGSLTVNGISRFETVGGDEGGEIEFGIPQTNTTLVNSVKVDVWRDRLRIFEGSANAKGVFIDLSKAPAGVGGELLWKASGFVNAGDYVTLGNLKARIPTSGNRSLQVATVSGTYSVYGSNIYSQIGGIAGATLSSPLSITTTPTYLNAANGFTVAGAMDTWVIIDTVNFIAWRITMVIGPLFNANLITIERLY